MGPMPGQMPNNNELLNEYMAELKRLQEENT